jgi:hypothetical protein
MKYDLVDQRVEQTRRIEEITEERVVSHQNVYCSCSKYFKSSIQSYLNYNRAPAVKITVMFIL